MKLAIFSHSLKAARGTERVITAISQGLAKHGHEVDLLLEDDGGWLVERLRSNGKGPRVIALREGRSRRFASQVAATGLCVTMMITACLSMNRKGISAANSLRRKTRVRKPPLSSLVAYLRREDPDLVVSFLNYPNMALLMAARIYRGQSRFVVNVRNHISISSSCGESKWMRRIPELMRHLYPKANGIFAPSKGVAQDIAEIMGIPSSEISVVTNPVYCEELRELAQQPVEHPWLREGNTPVIVTASKMRPQKDLPNLLKAFAILRTRQPVRLVILGQGPDRKKLVELADQLGISEDLDLPGHVENPYAYFSRASVFVLSSRFEGLPNVLIEALACGCPVVSTNCPSGPSEILAEGEFGRLVPMGDPEALAAAIEATLLDPPSPERLLERARCYSVENSVAEYETALGSVLDSARSSAA